MVKDLTGGRVLWVSWVHCQGACPCCCPLQFCIPCCWKQIHLYLRIYWMKVPGEGTTTSPPPQCSSQPGAQNQLWMPLSTVPVLAFPFPLLSCWSVCSQHEPLILPSSFLHPCPSAGHSPHHFSAVTAIQILEVGAEEGGKGQERETD